MDWNDLRYVLAVSRAGTLAAAARRLRVDQTTVARRLAAVERALGARLFERIDGNLRPTRSGEAAIAQAERVEQEVDALERGIGGADAKVAGSVRLTAVPVLVNRLLVPASAGLQATHPGLRLELNADSRNLSLTRREADIALRFARPESGRAVLARRIGLVAYALYGPQRRTAKGLPWLTYDESLAHLPQARWIDQARGGEPVAPLALSDAGAIAEAVRAGLGKSLLPCFAADGDPGLRRLDRSAALSRELWLLTHEALRHQARIAAVVDWLTGLVKARLP